MKPVMPHLTNGAQGSHKTLDGAEYLTSVSSNSSRDCPPGWRCQQSSVSTCRQKELWIAAVAGYMSRPPKPERGWISLEGPSLHSHGHRNVLCTWHCLDFCYKDFFNAKELLLELKEEKREERPLV